MIALTIRNRKGTGEILFKKLKHGYFTIGREEKSDIFLNDRTISRMHCVVIVSVTGGVMVRDLESRGGTFVEGERIEAKKLLPGHKVSIGSYEIEVG